jgi:GntR family transcriptional repressor for pyruvate dehydrogenase complex
MSAHRCSDVLEGENRMKLVEKVQLGIEEMILNKEYDESRYLPSEGDLCVKFDVSRATVREAVRSLEVRGFVKRMHGKGIVVVDNSVKVLTRSLSDVISRGESSVLDLIEVRNIIEVEAARLAAERALAEDLAQMEGYLEHMETALVMDESYYTNDLNFHLIMAKASGNPLLYSIMKSFEPLLRDVVIVSSQEDFCIERQYGYHRAIFEAIRAGKGEEAMTAVKRHMKATSDNVHMRILS